ncbi:MAG TPA: hypothetical protein VKC34_01485, partial [Blastocatellia bacterium]|nr:hypothetical protein [Blastocatellia bacterium]
MPKPTQIPFHLCQVLEEEFINLHRQLNPKPGWEFEGDQINSPHELARKLREASSESSKDRISKHLRSWLSRLKPELIKEIDGQRVPDADAFSDALNLILPRKEFYSEKAFAELRLPDATQQLVRLGTREGELSFVNDDLMRFNRLLVEGVYPEEISEIYEVRLAKIIKLIHSENSAALCLSGGGIRSGTFCLGIIQGLARHGMLSKFHYLSTVSGGGYTGGWLSAWINRHPRGLSGVADDIIHKNPKSKIVPDAEPVQHMREYGSFVTPKFTLLSADVWAFVTIYLRNLMLNWLVIIPLLLAVLAIPRLNLSLLQELPSHSVALTVFVIAILLSGFSVGYLAINRPSVADALKRSKFWSRRTGQASFLKWCLLPFTVSVFLFSLNWAWFRNHSIDVDDQIEALVGDKLWSWLIFMLFGLVVHFVGWLVALIILHRFRFIELVTVFITGPVGGLLTWLVVTGVFGKPVMPAVAIKESYSYLEDRFTIDPTTGLYATFAVPLFMVAMFLAVTFFVGLTSRKAWDRVPRARRVPARNQVGNTVVIEDE